MKPRKLGCSKHSRCNAICDWSKTLSAAEILPAARPCHTRTSSRTPMHDMMQVLQHAQRGPDANASRRHPRKRPLPSRHSTALAAAAGSSPAHAHDHKNNGTTGHESPKHQQPAQRKRCLNKNGARELNFQHPLGTTSGYQKRPQKEAQNEGHGQRVTKFCRSF